MATNNLNNSLRLVKPSATLVINELSSKLINEGVEIFRYGFGQSPFPVPDKIVKALQNNAHQKDYLPVKGLYKLREIIADFFKNNYELDATAEDIMIGPGSKELIYNFQVTYNIEELLLPSPSWVSYEPQAQLTNHNVAWIPTDEKNNWKLKPNDIIGHCKDTPNKTRTIILNYPSNPTGASYTAIELMALAEVFKQFNIIVIADEIYGEVHHEGNHQTIAKFYPQGTIISTGLSKWAGAGGWRLGFFVFPKNLRYILDAMAIVASETYTSTSAPIQFAAVEAYREDESTKLYLENSRKILKEVGLYVYNQLMNIGVTMPKPEGGFYLFPNFNKWKDALVKKGIFTSKDFCNVLLKETGVALLPGEAFGHPKENFTARLTYVDFDGKELLNILKETPSVIVDGKFVEQYCPRMILGTKKIEQWILSL
ncbi:MAG: aminotransferase class I/II-fold pyridoxal phosphate-dependent enzyme [Flavobacteriales bacterium]|jgi:aspartate aminotransferase|nr:MAG: aspartate aminotransferase [Cryomorphaceae bacterium BACL22 MAG-120619-bin32]NQW35725.1 aminotransferase class I/II-fold pyridoxal phosphate-dependent enzyme [Flavobacteriales bacterium]